MKHLHGYLPGHSSADGHRWRGAEQTHIDSRSGEGGLLCRYGDVAAGNELASCCRGNAIHHGDHWYRYVLDQSHDLKQKSRHFMRVDIRNQSIRVWRSPEAQSK